MAGDVPTVVTIPGWADAGECGRAGSRARRRRVARAPSGARSTRRQAAARALAAAAPGLPLVLYHRPPLQLEPTTSDGCARSTRSPASRTVIATSSLPPAARGRRWAAALAERVGGRRPAFWAARAATRIAPASAAYAPAYAGPGWATWRPGTSPRRAACSLRTHTRWSTCGSRGRASTSSVVKAAMAEIGLPAGDDAAAGAPLTAAERELVRILVQRSRPPATGARDVRRSRRREHEPRRAGLRSDRWYRPDTLKARSATARAPSNSGSPAGEFVARPVIGILNTWSDITPCHQHFRQRAEDVKRGVLVVRRLPVEIPRCLSRSRFRSRRR